MTALEEVMWISEESGAYESDIVHKPPTRRC